MWTTPFAAPALCSAPRINDLISPPTNSTITASLFPFLQIKKRRLIKVECLAQGQLLVRVELRLLPCPLAPSSPCGTLPHCSEKT